MVDLDRNGLVSESEWQDFYEVFLMPFKDKCDENNNFAVEIPELQQCMESVESLQDLSKMLR